MRFPRPWTLLALLLGLFMRVGAAAGAATPSPALLVLNKGADELLIVDPQTNQVVARVPLGPDPHEVVVSPDGRFAFTSSYGAERDPHNTISVADLKAQTELRRVEF